MFKLRIKFKKKTKKTTRKLQMYDITPYDKNPSTRVNNGWYLTVLRTTLVRIAYFYRAMLRRARYCHGKLFVRPFVSL